MKLDRVARVLLILMIPCFLAGCQAVFLKSSYGSYYSQLAPEGYAKEIKRLTLMTDREKPNFRPIAHLYLSLLHLSYNNPSRDYVKALEELEKYIIIEPAILSNYEIQNLLDQLKEINSTQKLTSGLAKIELTKEKLKENNEALAAENKKLVNSIESQKKELLEKDGILKERDAKIKELNETIDKLKNLDMELEKKRKSFR